MRLEYFLEHFVALADLVSHGAADQEILGAGLIDDLHLDDRIDVAQKCILESW